jgi:hypothetical protein
LSDIQWPKIFFHSVGCFFRRFFIWFSPICQFSLLIAELLELYSGSYDLCPYDLVFFPFFAVVVYQFQVLIKIFDPLWINTSTGI